MKKLLSMAFAASVALSASATVGSGVAQEGYSLQNVYSLENIAPQATKASHRSGVGVNDKWYVNEHATGVKVYDNTGALIKTIKAPEGYFLWTSLNVDAAGNVIVQLDKKAFDGANSVKGGHGFMVIDSKTDEIVKEFLPMTFSYDCRFDVQPPVNTDILGADASIIAVLSGKPTSYRFPYANGEAGETVAVNTSAGLDQMTGATAASSSGMGMYYTLGEETAVALYPNQVATVTYSAEGKYGNAIQKYNTKFEASGKYFYTPGHSGMQGFNFFELQGKQYIIYPVGGATLVGDAFAITELTMVDSPLTDMTMEGEALVDGKPAGPMVARAFAAVGDNGAVAYPTLNYTPITYNIEPVEGEPNSVYIYAFASGAPGNKWKFSVPAAEQPGELAGQGEGTLESPYNVARVLALYEAGKTDAEAEVYVEGTVKSITELSTQFGNATYYITDEGSDNEFLIFRGKDLGNKKFTSEDDLKEGDKVVVLGKLIVYVNKDESVLNEMAQNNYLISINGETERPEPAPTPGVDFSDCTGTEEAVIEAASLTVPGVTKFIGEDQCGYGFNVEQGEGASTPAINGADVRLYANNTITIAGGKLTSIKFTLNSNSVAKRYAPLTASTGTVSEQAAGDEFITWTGDATEVTFTVGAKADFGTEPTKAGQVHFSQILINEKVQEPEPEPVQPEFLPTTVGGTETFKSGYTLSNEWAIRPSDATSANVRMGVGANDHFFINDYTTGKVKIYSETKLVKEVTIPGKYAWVSNTTDNAGNVIIRCDDQAFSTTYPNFYNGKSGVAVINSETLELAKDFIPFAEIHIDHSTGDRDDVRFDAMGHVYGDVLGEAAYLYAPSTRFGKRCEEFVFANGACTEHNWFEVAIDEAFAGAAKNNQTLGSAQQYTDNALALYSNPVYSETSSDLGLGNGIQLYELTEGKWTASGKYFTTPQHAAIGGFMVFSLQGKDFILYPAGATRTGDAFAISEVTFTDTPKTAETDTEALVARQYAATQGEAATLVNPIVHNYINYNVEAVEGDANSVYIYVYTGGANMSKWKFSFDPTQSGVANIEADENAPVEYYNLQGIRVANPQGGIFIRRQGNKATKVVL